MSLKKNPLHIRRLLEALGTFTAGRATDELLRLQRPKAYPRSYLNGHVHAKINYYLNVGKLERLADGRYRWIVHPSNKVEILPEPPAPKMDLTDYNQNSEFWKDRARDAKP